MTEAGFIEPPVTGPPIKTQSTTVKPMARAGTAPLTRASVATEIMTSIKMNERNISVPRFRKTRVESPGMWTPWPDQTATPPKPPRRLHR